MKTAASPGETKASSEWRGSTAGAQRRWRRRRHREADEARERGGAHSSSSRRERPTHRGTTTSRTDSHTNDRVLTSGSSSSEHKAGIAQLGERSTEDAKVACSIHADGSGGRLLPHLFFFFACPPPPQPPPAASSNHRRKPRRLHTHRKLSCPVAQHTTMLTRNLDHHTIDCANG